PRGLLLGSVLALSLTGCQMADSDAHVRADAMGLISDALGKVRAADALSGDVVSNLGAMAAATPGLANVAATVEEQRQALYGMKLALQSYGGRVAELGKCACEGNLEAFGRDVVTEIAGLPKVESALAAAKQAAEALKSAPAAAAPVAFVHKLSTGVELKAAQNGIESELVAFVDDASKAVDKSTWFNFDQLTFKLAAAELDMAKSKPQLDNIIEILKAYPKVNLKVGGYTDNTGAAAANKKLSQGRADAVKAALVAGGIATTRLEAEGFGPQFPVCAANDTEECKAQNRRVSVRVTAK
ncbi:MAG: OmpA/MotB domain protein, partial [Pseudomonadota bacterium]